MYKVKLTVSGRVQGVGFRYFVTRLAKKYGILGQVWNNDDGTVGVFAQHENSQIIAKFTADIRQGAKNPWAKVTYLDSETGNFGDYEDFRVRY